MKTLKFRSAILIMILSITIGFTFVEKTSALNIPVLTKPISQMTVPELQAKIVEIIQAIQQLQALIYQLKAEPKELLKFLLAIFSTATLSTDNLLQM